MSLRPVLSLSDYVQGVLARDRGILARAITLVESKHPEQERVARALIGELLPYAGGSRRLGFSGTPGAGKSTLIDAVGTMLADSGRSLAVLAVDPSSAASGGSILGDRTRMAELASRRSAFIRPSPAGGSVGGVARRTREAMVLCEAGGFDVVIVETVGIGQTEAAVASMVDYFVLLALTGAGDELQGIKRGVLELVDLLVVTKADGENRVRSERTRDEYARALRVLRPQAPPEVLCVSAREGRGLEEIWATFDRAWETARAAGSLAEKRKAQQLAWFDSLLEQAAMETFRRHPAVASRLPGLREQVAGGSKSAAAAVDTLVEALIGTEDVEKS